MTNITKELREWFKCHLFMGNSYVFMGNDYAELTAITDRIDAELAERYAALPLDMDGKPIHIGDVMEMDGDSELYDVVGFYDLGFLAWRNGRFVPCAASLYRHHEPDTWESIIYDAMQAGRTEETIDVTPLIERCKALVDSKVKALEDEIRELGFHEDMGQ